MRNPRSVSSWTISGGTTIEAFGLGVWLNLSGAPEKFGNIRRVPSMVNRSRAIRSPPPS